MDFNTIQAMGMSDSDYKERVSACYDAGVIDSKAPALMTSPYQRNSERTYSEKACDSYDKFWQWEMEQNPDKYDPTQRAIVSVSSIIARYGKHAQKYGELNEPMDITAIRMAQLDVAASILHNRNMANKLLGRDSPYAGTEKLMQDFTKNLVHHPISGVSHYQHNKMLLSGNPLPQGVSPIYEEQSGIYHYTHEGANDLDLDELDVETREEVVNKLNGKQFLASAQRLNPTARMTYTGDSKNPYVNVRSSLAERRYNQAYDRGDSSYIANRSYEMHMMHATDVAHEELRETPKARRLPDLSNIKAEPSMEDDYGFSNRF